MNASGAETETAGAPEKQACRNFIAAIMASRCGANTLRAMQGAFVGDKPAKILALYESIVDSKQSEGIEARLIVPFENLAANHMMNVPNLKGAIDVALNGELGEDIVPFDGEFNGDEINAAEILDDLLNRAEQNIDRAQ
jgi:hypothetical protein